MQDEKEKAIVEFLKKGEEASSKAVFEGLGEVISYATVKRLLVKLKEDRLVITHGQGKATKYAISPALTLFEPIDLEAYYQVEIDERKIKRQFDFSMLRETLPVYELFTKSEATHLQALQDRFQANIAQLSPMEYNKEMERLAIDLSWKSSQIEGNTYSLLETERLLKEKLTATGKTKDEATMLLNHKEALDFIIANPDYLTPITIRAIEDIHQLLTKELGVTKNVRHRRVGITGTNYQPLDNEYQIREALGDTCNLINAKPSVFEKALLALVLLSYIQPFMDGNKRTARIVSNAVLIQHQHCPISFRTVDAIEYKKAMLLFYEQNNIHSFKQIFIDQFEFAVNTYF
jgi:fido (protein-threonine AMPylation protein)/predicted transcriptional regulator